MTEALNYFELNTRQLFAKYPELKTALKAFKPTSELEFQETPSGFPTARYHGIYIHSRHNPQKEALTILQSQLKAEPDICLFYGFGLGYLLEGFIQLFPNCPCLLVEPDISFFLKALQARDLRRVINHPRLVIFLASDASQIIQYLDENNYRQVQIVKLRSLYQKDLAYYEGTDSLLQSYLRQREININTLRRFGKLWLRNILQNLEHFLTSPGIIELKDYFKGLAGLVCAAGPSLEAILPLLKELSTKLIVIAVDTSLSALKRHGLEPNFTVVSDPQYFNTRHLDYIRNTSSFIVAELSTNPRIFRILKAPVFFYSSVFPLSKYFEGLVPAKGRLLAGGSVATTAWDLARLLGLNPIYVAGLDLGFPERKTHFKGAFFEEGFHSQANRFAPQETAAFRYLLSGLPFLAQANSGQPIITDHRMALYKFWFETQMRLNPSLSCFNLSWHGLAIKGMPFLDQTELLKMPNLPDLKARLDKISSLFKKQPLNPDLKNKLKESYYSLIEKLSAFQVLCKEAQATALKASSTVSQNEKEALLDELKSLDEKISQHEVKEIASFLAGPLINEILSKHIKGPQFAWEESLKLYQELNYSLKTQLELLEAFASRIT